MDTLRTTVARFGFNSNTAPQTDKTIPSGTYSQGIGNAGPARIANASPSSLDRLTRATFFTRLATILFFLLALICTVVAAVFQSKWIGATSGLTNFLFFANAAFLLVLAFFTLIPWLAQRSSGGKRIADLERALREDRVGIVGNAFCLLFGMIVAVTQLVSALGSAACKDPANDPHAKSSKGSEDDFKAALPSFCRTKRALAAFLWLGWFGFLALGVLFFYSFKRSRKAGPRIPPFVHPGGGSDGGAFQPLGGEDYDDDDPHAAPHATEDDYRAQARYGGDPYAATDMRYDPQATPAVPGGYNTGFSASVTNIETRYGMQPQTQQYSTHNVQQHYTSHPQLGYDVTPNPFADALAQAQPLASAHAAPAYGAPPQQADAYRNSYDYGAYSASGHPGYGGPRY